MSEYLQHISSFSFSLHSMNKIDVSPSVPIGLPYIRLIPKVTAVAGETLHLKCPVAGYPIEEIHWERGTYHTFVTFLQHVFSFCITDQRRLDPNYSLYYLHIL